MTTISFYSLRIFKISPYIEFFIFFDRILAPPSERRPGADAPPVTVFKKLTNAVVEDTDFINVLLTKPSTKSRQRNNN